MNSLMPFHESLMMRGVLESHLLEKYDDERIGMPPL